MAEVETTALTTDGKFSRGGDMGKEHVLPLRFEGHALLCRKCVTKVDYIELCERSQDKSLVAEVLAIGPRVGKRCTKRHSYYYKRVEDEERRPMHLNMDLKVGDMLLFPDGHFAGIKNAQFNKFDYYIEEALALAKYGGDGMGLKPIGDRILVTPVEEEKEEGGIVIPDAYQKQTRMGIVVALGTGKRDERGTLVPFNVVVGDTVLLPKIGGWYKVKHEGVEYFIISEGDTLGVVV